MIKKLLCYILAGAMIVPFAAPVNSVADEATPRIMEKLDRGLIAAKVSGGVYLSWRLL